MSAARGPEQAAVDALRDEILNPATSPLALAVDIPFKAAMLGVPWSVVRSLFDQRGARQSVRPRHPARPDAEAEPPPPRFLSGGGRVDEAAERRPGAVR